MLAGIKKKFQTHKRKRNRKQKKTIRQKRKKNSEEKPEAAASGQLNPAIGEETEGNVEVLYTNNDAKYPHNMNGFKVSVDGYEIAKVTDMNESSKMWFDDQIDGFVITAKVTIENSTDKVFKLPPAAAGE